RADAEWRGEELRGLRPDAREVHELADAAGQALPQLLQVGHGAGIGPLADLGGQVGADARDLLPGPQRLHHVLRQALELVGAPAVGADAEDVVLADLQEVRDLVEAGGQLEVAHRRRVRRPCYARPRTCAWRPTPLPSSPPGPGSCWSRTWTGASRSGATRARRPPRCWTRWPGCGRICPARCSCRSRGKGRSGSSGSCTS